MLTLRQFLEVTGSLKAFIRNYNINHYAKIEVEEYLEDWKHLGHEHISAFSWSDSPENEEYWYDLYNMFNDHLAGVIMKNNKRQHAKP